jgi:U3 small nucleolar RNA-associated protein 14
MTLKKNINMNQEGVDILNKKVLILYETMDFYAKCKKRVINEEFLFPIKIDTGNDTSVSSVPNSSDSSPDSSSSEESDTASEYEFSDVDEKDDNEVNKNMAKSLIMLNRNRQAKQFLYINKKNLTH